MVDLQSRLKKDLPARYGKIAIRLNVLHDYSLSSISCTHTTYHIKFQYLQLQMASDKIERISQNRLGT